MVRVTRDGEVIDRVSIQRCVGNGKGRGVSMSGRVGLASMNEEYVHHRCGGWREGRYD